MLVQLRSANRFVDAARRTKQAAYDKGFVLAAFPGGPARIGDQGDSAGSSAPDEGVVPVKYIKMLNRVFPGLMPAARRSRRWLERNVSDAYRATINGLGALISSEEGKNEEEKKKPNPGPQSSGGDAASLPPDGPNGGEKDRTNRDGVKYSDFKRASTALEGNDETTLETKYLEKKPEIPKDQIKPLPKYSKPGSVMTADEFNWNMPNAGSIDPHKIGTVQSSVSQSTKIVLRNGKTADISLSELVAGLKSGKIKPENLQPIKLYSLGGRVVTEDNRRLVAARLAGVRVRYIVVENPHLERIFRKVSSLNPNGSIGIR